MLQSLKLQIFVSSQSTKINSFLERKNWTFLQKNKSLYQRLYIVKTWNKLAVLTKYIKSVLAFFFLKKLKLFLVLLHQNNLFSQVRAIIETKHHLLLDLKMGATEYMYGFLIQKTKRYGKFMQNRRRKRKPYLKREEKTFMIAVKRSSLDLRL